MRYLRFRMSGSADSRLVRRRLFFVLPILVFCGALNSCGRSPDEKGRKLPSSDALYGNGGRVSLENSMAPLYGAVFSSFPVRVIPVEGWSSDPGTKKWLMAAQASTFIYVARQPGASLDLLLKTEGEIRDDRFEAAFDGMKIAAPVIDSGLRRIQITVPSGSLFPGTHELILRRFDGAAGDVNQDKKYLLKRLRCRIGDDIFKVSAEKAGNDLQLMDFLTQGVLGPAASKERMGGFVFDGPRELPVRLSLARSGTLHLFPSNCSSADAEFYISGKDRRYSLYTKPAEKKEFRIPLGRGRQDLMLGVRGAAGGLFLWGAPYLAFDPPLSKTPVILITLDTTRRDSVAPYQSSKGGTPALEKFSRNATIYSQGYTTAPWTLPSHASIFTGLYPSAHQAGISSINLDHRFTTLAESLRDHDYFTGGFAGGVLMTAKRCVSQGFSIYRDPDDQITRADRMTAHALAFLGAHRDQPFFLFLNYFDPHFPYRAPPAFRERFQADRLTEGLDAFPLWRKGLEGKASILLKLINETGEVPEDVQRALSAAYHAEVAFMDEELGRLLDALKKLDLYDRALIAVVADHGEYLGRKGRLFHSFRLDEELMHIPFLIKWPGQKKPRVVDSRVSLVDLFATILDAAGIPVPDQDGVILRRTDRAFENRPFILLEEHGREGIHPLRPGVMKIADDLYGIIFKDHVVTAWEGGNRCYGFRDGRWIPQSCENQWPGDIARIRRYFKPVPAKKDQRAGTLTDQEIEDLRRLGYLH